MTINLNELRKIAEAATPGPWHHAEIGVLGAREDWDLGRGPARIMAAQMPWRRERMEANAKHVATFDPPTVLALIERIEQAEHSVERAKAIIATEKRQKGIAFARFIELDAQVARVREVLSEWDTDEDSKGLHFDIERALDGDTRA